MSDPLCTVVIPVKNGGTRLRECLEAVAAQEFAGGFEVLAIDSGSTDGSAELCEKFGKVIRIRPAEFNHGLTRNLGIENSRGRFAALLVQDAVPLGKDWLSSLIDACAEEGTAGAYSRQMPRPDCPPFIRARLLRWSASCTEREVKRLSGMDELLSLPFRERVRRVSFDNVSSCVRREAWEKTPFRERRFGEDVVWSREVQLKGWSVVFEPRSVVEHSHANSMWYEFKRVYLDHRNWREIAEGAVFDNFSQFAWASWNGIFERWAELEERDKKGLGELYWKAYAAPYSLSQNLAQYWGSRSMKAAIKIKWYHFIDEFMARGV